MAAGNVAVSAAKVDGTGPGLSVSDMGNAAVRVVHPMISEQKGSAEAAVELAAAEKASTSAEVELVRKVGLELASVLGLDQSNH